MIVDVHSHFFPDAGALSATFREEAGRAHVGDASLHTSFEAYAAAAPEPTRTIVFGGKARLSGLWVDDHDVAQYVRGHPDRLVGFLSVDPTQEGWQEELRHGHQELGLRGIKMMPMYAGFRPDDPALDDLWRYAGRHGLPVVSHTGTTFVSAAPLECSMPRHFDSVAARFPEVRIVMAHLGHPYEAECVVVARKHPHLYCDVSALHYRPWQLYHSLMLVQEYGIWGKLLFGSDYPFSTVNASLAGLRALGSVIPCHGLPSLRLDEIEAMIERPSLALLGLV